MHGWIGNSFFPEAADVFLGPIRDGAEAAGRTLADIDLTVAVGVEFTDDLVASGRRHAEGYAFTFGAMGSATTNLDGDHVDGEGDDRGPCSDLSEPARVGRWEQVGVNGEDREGDDWGEPVVGRVAL